jgi:hypothetical protein
MPINPWDVFKSLSNTKDRLIIEDNKDEYPSYLMNGAFSRFIDTVLDANEMNKLHHLDKLAQHDYYFYSIRRKRRYSGAWGKIVVTPEQEAVAAFYGYSLEKAKEALTILDSDNGLVEILDHYEKLKEINTL